MVVDQEQQDALLELLNITPVVNGAARHQLADPNSRPFSAGARPQLRLGERLHLFGVCVARQAVVRGTRPATSLGPGPREPSSNCRFSRKMCPESSNDS
ncbi:MULTISPECIES: hypothetical protein [unclassified Streptomyces]|uniref:hypothetical protein n=1 Tax=unclassified Streptomyces TaxID=2593676 RepID=UPI003D8B3FBD